MINSLIYSSQSLLISKMQNYRSFRQLVIFTANNRSKKLQLQRNILQNVYHNVPKEYNNTCLQVKTINICTNDVLIHIIK